METYKSVQNTADLFIQYPMLMYGDIHGIIQIENKTTAVKESANSPSPAQVVLAPTQRMAPHRRDIIPFLLRFCKRGIKNGVLCNNKTVIV